MSDKYIKEITQNIPNNELNAAYDALMNSSLNETSDYEEVSMEELNEYIEGLECQAEDLRKQLAKANERIKELERQLNQSKKINALIDECYLIRKSPTVGDLSIFMCAPVVCCGEKSSLTLYQEWAVYIDEQLRREQE